MNARSKALYACLGLVAACCLGLAAAQQPQLRADNSSAATGPVGTPAHRSHAWITLDSQEIAGIVVAAVIVFVAAGGGTGGGAVMSAIYTLIAGLDLKVAIPLSSITIVGGAIANFLLNVKKARRNSNAPLIDWDLILAMQPMLLLGANFGTFINAIFPAWLLSVLLVIILVYVGKRTVKKAIEQRRRERWGCWGDDDAAVSLIGARFNNQQAYSTSRNAIIPWKKIGALFGLFAGVVVLSLIAGTSKFPSIVGLSPTSFLGFIASFLPVIFLVVYSQRSMKNIQETFYRQQNPRYVLTPDEIQWSPRSVQYFPLVAMGAGTLAGMFGIGGGMINAPMLLELGVEPLAASAMTATTVLFSSSMSSFSYVLLGALDFRLAVLLLPMGFVATFLGHVLLERLIQRFNCPSLIVWSMAIIIIISAGAMTVESFRTLSKGE
ncbi:hypothetical protein P43SY_004272 [Pythium insidiosum]|uniref:Membrane transporter protein n=1 Tax=Pythium insidiosum TaxID=114742 RepID=A0AAD5Q849_PYTIN|nr:hypothetical protein P43SY_004272 [Pythium insidiosum]